MPTLNFVTSLLLLLVIEVLLLIAENKVVYFVVFRWELHDTWIFGPPEQNGLQNDLQRLKHLFVAVLERLVYVGFPPPLIRPGIQFDEVDQGEEIIHFVLNWSSRWTPSVVTVEVEYGIGCLAGFVLNLVGFVEYNPQPVVIVEGFLYH